MPSIHQSLLALQSIDTDLESGRRRVRDLQAELANDPAVAAARDNVAVAESQLAIVEKAIHEGEATIERLKGTIKTLEKRLYDGSVHNAREAAGIEEELRHRRAERDETERVTLDAMEQADVIAEALAGAQARFKTMSEDRGARASALRAEGRATMARIQTLQEQRAAVASAAPAALLARYERLRHTLSPAVTVVHAGACAGCGVAVPTALQQRAGSGEFVQCLNCNRILVGA